MIGHLALAALLQITPARPRCSVQDAAQADGSVWILCNFRDVHISADQGKTWTQSRLPQEFKHRAIAALDAQQAIVIGDQGNLWRTADRGKTWTKIAVDTEAVLTDVQFLADLGWIGGYSGMILHSKDRGQTWTKQPTIGSESVESISFADPLHGLAVGWGGAILRTVDGGAKWERVKAPAALWSFSSVFMKDVNNAWAVGMSGQLMRTTDGGATWTAQRLEASGSLSSVFFDKRGRGWITSDRDIYTSPDGDKWSPSGLNDWVFLNEIIEVGGTLWAAGPLDIYRRGEKGWESLP